MCIPLRANGLLRNAAAVAVTGFGSFVWSTLLDPHLRSSRDFVAEDLFGDPGGERTSPSWT